MLLDKRHTYKPFSYPFAYDAYKKHEMMHWMPHAVVMTDDIVDWERNLNRGQKEFLTHLFRFFTQADVSVASAYGTKLIPLFGGNPEVAMMMLSFGAREAVHVDAYALLIDTLGFPASTYSAFMEYAAMRDKYNFLETINTTTHMDIARSLAVYSAFTEGMQLYASFAMLMHFERIGKMPGMTNIVRWSIKDEACHAENMLKVFRVFVSEYLSREDAELLEPEIRSVAEKMVGLEDKFIDLAFSVSGIEINEGLPPSQKPITEHELKMYIRHIADYRLQELGMKPIYGIPQNPLRWLDDLMLSPEHANFFEVKPTEYAKGSIDGNITEW